MTRNFLKRDRFILILVINLLAAFPLQADTVAKTLRLSFDIEPMTALKVVSSAGVSAVRLGPISPQAQVPVQSIEVSVLTNGRQRYRIYHRLEGGVFNASGSEFPRSKILFMASPGVRGGASEIPNFREVPDGDIVIFTSKSEGGTENFQLLYTVNNDEVFPAGLFSGSVHLDVRTE